LENLRLEIQGSQHEASGNCFNEVNVPTILSSEILKSYWENH
jgi:hypothetical protein